MDHQQQVPSEGDGETQCKYSFRGATNTNNDSNGNFTSPLEMCGEVGMMPSLQHVSSGVWSDASYHYDPQQPIFHSYQDDDDDAAASMENNEDPESDYDFDISEDAESKSGDDDDEEEESEEEGLDESCEGEDSNLSDADLDEVVDIYQMRFQELVSSTIDAAEEYLDNPSTLYFAKLNNSTKPTESEMHFNLDMLIASERKAKQSTAKASACKTKEYNHMEIQTDDDCVLSGSSGTIVPSSNNQSLINLKADQAELEINELQSVKESLMKELENWEVLLEEEGEMKTENEIKEAERIMCKINESVRAVEKAIGFKNEIVKGIAASTHRQSSSSSTDALGDMEYSKLVANLDTISVQQVQRLFGVYFEKTVELRYSSHELKNDLRRATKRHDDLNRRYARKTKQARELEEQHKARLLEFLSKNTDSSYYSMFRRKQDQLSAALKKHDGYEKELTKLLVRHGYLLEGMDYDVQQVLRTLGIDEDEGQQASDNVMQKRSTRRGGISEGGASAGENYQYDGGDEIRDHHPSRHYDEKQTSSGRHGQRGGDRNVRFLNEPGCSNAPSSSNRNRGFLSPPPVPTPTLHTTEVRRDKRRLIIHPSTTTAEAGGSGGGSSGSHRKSTNYDAKQSGSSGRKKR